MSSVIPLQVACGQFGVSFFRIMCRYLSIGAWPVRNWVSMLVCLRLRELVIVIYLSEGNEGSMRLIFLNLGDFFHHSFVSILIFAERMDTYRSAVTCEPAVSRRLGDRSVPGTTIPTIDRPLINQVAKPQGIWRPLRHGVKG